MNARPGTTLRDGDRVTFQRTADSPAHPCVVLDASSHRAKELDAVLVKGEAADAGHPQYVPGAYLSVNYCV